MTDEVLFDDFAKWDALDMTGINAALQPDKFQIDQIKFAGLSTSMIVGPDHRLNFLTIMPPKAASAQPDTNTAPPKIPELTLGEFVFTNASLHFADRSIEPNCLFDVQAFSGSVKNISSLVQTPSDLDIKGKIDEFSTFSLGGKLNPMPNRLFTDIAITFTNTGLTAFSPYTEKYAGRPLEKGKLSLALHYKIDRKTLDSQNGIFIDQLTLGAKNSSTNATSLPVKLAIALLKDRNGRIKLDVPVAGHLDDPKFKLWPIIWHVIGNLIVKAATSPFSLLGSMFGGGKELTVSFEPGHADVLPADGKILDALAKSLYDRPTLTLEISGSVDPARDRDELLRAKFERQIKAIYIKELTDAGKPPVAAEELTLAPADYERLVPIAYSNSFGAYVPPTATNQITNAPAPAPLPLVKPVAAAPVAKAKPAPSTAGSFFAHGGARMILLEEEKEIAAAPPPTPKPVIPTAETNKPVGPASPPVAQSDLSIMQEKLLQKIQVTSDDFRQLMIQRAKGVEAYLLKSGKVTGDRIFLTAPRAIDTNYKGEDKVSMTLD